MFGQFYFSKVALSDSFHESISADMDLFRVAGGTTSRGPRVPILDLESKNVGQNPLIHKHIHSVNCSDLQGWILSNVSMENKTKSRCTFGSWLPKWWTMEHQERSEKLFP